MAHIYERHRRRPHGSHSKVIAIVFHIPESVAYFYNALNACRGSSFGANFTLAISFAQVVHPHKLDWVDGHGVPMHIVWISLELEEKGNIVQTVERVLETVERSEAKNPAGQRTRVR